MQRSIWATIGLIVLFTVAYYLPFFDLSKDLVRMSPRADETSTDITPHVLGPAGSPAAALPVRELSPSHLVVPLPPGSGGFIVFSEKFALFEGWKAELATADARVALPLLRANHVNTAVWIPPGGSRELHLDYATPYLGTGLALLFATLGALAVFAWVTRRGDGRAVRAGKSPA